MLKIKRKKVAGSGEQKNTRRGATTWALLKDEFINAHLAGAGPSLREFAEAKGIPKVSMERHSTKEKWYEEIERRKNQLMVVTAQRAEDVREALMKKLNFDEIELRNHLGDTGKLVETVGRVRLARLLQLATRGDPERVDAKGKPAPLAPDPSLLDAIDPVQAAIMVKIGQESQRKAYGLAEKFIEVDINHKALSPAEALFQKQIKNRGRVQAVLSNISRIIEGEVVERSERKANRR